jgi:hypothetical protein
MFLLFPLFFIIFSVMLSCAKSTSVRQVVHTKIPHDWVHQPPDNCGVGSSELSSVDADIEVAMEIAKEYAQIHLAERLSHLKSTTEIQGLLGASDEILELEHTMLEEHTVLEEAAHVSFEHGVNTMFVLVCLED